MKKHTIQIWSMGLALCLVFCLTTSRVQAEEKKIIRVAFPEQTGFSSTDSAGNHSGYTYEFLEEIAKYTGWEYEFITGDSSDESLLKMMEDLKNGRIDIMGGMVYTPQLAEDYDFPEYNCGYSYSTLSVLKDNEDVNATNYSTFNNMKVGARKTATRRIQALNEFCRANGITLSIVEYDSDEGNTEVVSGINTATAAINEQNPNYATELYMKYFNKNNQQVTLESFIKANPTESIVAALGIGLVLAAVVGMTMYIRMQRNQQMLLNYERYRILSEMSKEFIFEYDYREDSIVVSEQFAHTFGGKSQVDHFFSTILSKRLDIDESARCFAGLIKRRPPEEARYEVEYKTTVPSGNEEWVRATSMIIFDKHNQPMRAIGKIININAEQCEKEALINQAHRDALTGLYNRTTFEELVNTYLQERGDEEGAMMVVDLDHFKTVNDTLGHQGGDEVLEDLAREMTACFGEEAVLGRLGGDEFLVFVKDVKACRDKPVQATRALCRAMNRCYERNSGQIEVSVSVGLAYSFRNSAFEMLYSMADEALYYMKDHGKNNVKVYDASIGDALGNNDNNTRKGAF